LLFVVALGQVIGGGGQACGRWRPYSTSTRFGEDVVMNTTMASAAAMTDAQKTEHIKAVVLKEGAALRQRYPILLRQNLIGALILTFSLAGMIAAGTLYYFGLIAWYVCVPVAALFASFTHELEHDLIHLMYFRNKPWAHNLMMALVWLARPSTISPWTRRRLHLHHHKYSGTDTDLEEQGITNGQPWGIRRVLMMSDQMLSVVLRPLEMRQLVKRFIKAQNPKSKAEYRMILREQLLGYMPLGRIYYTLWHAFIAYHVVNFIAISYGATLPWPAVVAPWVAPSVAMLNFVAVTWLAPNALRMFCLHLVSSNMHYYGDVEPKNVMQQCQVLNVWWMAPFNLFCFNFGSTHAIHHFVVKEPFYIRQLSAPVAHRVMREMGVRFNDIPSIWRANRWHSAVQPVMPRTPEPSRT
jgi:fatty acid desaturase